MKGKDIEFPGNAVYLERFKLLRLLVFVKFKFARRKLPRGIGNLIHLRYLCLQQCDSLDELPSSIRRLSYLHTLKVDSLNVHVPNVLKKMFRLKNLSLPSYIGYNVGGCPLELDEGLDELETLIGFDSSMHGLKSILRMKNLRRFGARVHDNESLSSIIDAITTEWRKLHNATILIAEGCEFVSTEEGLMVLKKVFACPNLQNLVMYALIGKRLRECITEIISSRSLVHLCLLNCEIEDDPMEILGKLPALRNLHLWSRSFVGEEMTCPAYSFPRLTKLELQKLPNLREWRIEEGAMPLLSHIKITECLNLMILPDGLRFISTLQELIITEMPWLGKRVSAEEEEDFDKVRHVPSIIIN